MQSLMENAAAIRLTANAMIASGSDTLNDGTKLTMELFDSWDEKEQRAFVCNFLCDRYDALTTEERMTEMLKMEQICHRCGARGEDDLNGQTGKLLSFDDPSGRWCLRLDGGNGESVRIKATNFTLHQEFRFRVANDGSMTVRALRDKVRTKFGGAYAPSQFSLWRSLPSLTRMEVDYIDEQSVPRPKRLCDYGVGTHPETRLLNVLISPMVKTPRGMPEELDPDSEYRRARVWPDWMAHGEKVQAHADLFGEGEQARYEGPPNHPDVETLSSFSVPRPRGNI